MAVIALCLVVLVSAPRPPTSAQSVDASEECEACRTLENAKDARRHQLIEHIKHSLGLDELPSVSAAHLPLDAPFMREFAPTRTRTSEMQADQVSSTVCRVTVGRPSTRASNPTTRRARPPPSSSTSSPTNVS